MATHRQSQRDDSDVREQIEEERLRGIAEDEGAGEFDEIDAIDDEPGQEDDEEPIL